MKRVLVELHLRSGSGVDGEILAGADLLERELVLMVCFN